MSKLVAVAGKVPNAAEEPESAPESTLETGDVFVSDTSEYIGQWDGEMLALPMELSMVVGPYEYFYKLDRREKRNQDPV